MLEKPKNVNFVLVYVIILKNWRHNEKKRVSNKETLKHYDS